MKILLFNVNRDEMAYINQCNETYQFELQFADFDFNDADKEKFMNFDAVWLTTNCRVTKDKCDQLKQAGIRYIVSRAAGTDHLDIQSMREAFIRGANVPRYSPNAIAEHTVCLILMALRHMKKEVKMIEQNDFTLSGLKGRELRNMTVGVVGTGRIGAVTIQILRGFGCKVLANDVYENQEIKSIVNYVEMNKLFSESDIVVLHCPLTKENETLISAKTIDIMKDKVVLINTARGGLMDYEAVLQGIETGKISAAAFDVFDEEVSYIRKKAVGDVKVSDTLKKLIEKENVIYTAHMSFFTDTAIENMIQTTFENLAEYDQTGRCSNDIYE